MGAKGAVKEGEKTVDRLVAINEPEPPNSSRHFIPEPPILPPIAAKVRNNKVL